MHERLNHTSKVTNKISSRIVIRTPFFMACNNGDAVRSTVKDLHNSQGYQRWPLGLLESLRLIHPPGGDSFVFLPSCYLLYIYLPSFKDYIVFLWFEEHGRIPIERNSFHQHVHVCWLGISAHEIVHLSQFCLFIKLHIVLRSGYIIPLLQPPGFPTFDTLRLLTYFEDITATS